MSLPSEHVNLEKVSYAGSDKLSPLELAPSTAFPDKSGIASTRLERI